MLALRRRPDPRACRSCVAGIFAVVRRRGDRLAAGRRRSGAPLRAPGVGLDAADDRHDRPVDGAAVHRTSSSSAAARCASSPQNPQSRASSARSLLDQQSIVSVVIAVVVLGWRRATSCSAPASAGRPARCRTTRRSRPRRASPSTAIIRIVWIARRRPRRPRRRAARPLLQRDRAGTSGGALLLLMFAAVTLGGLGHRLRRARRVARHRPRRRDLDASSIADATCGTPAALVILILVLLVRPQGILGRAERIG